MPYQILSRTRLPAVLVLAASLAACDDPVTMDPAEPLVPAAFAGGIPIGPTALPNGEFGERFNGTHRNIAPADLLTSLAAIQARGGKVSLLLAGGPNQYKDADGHFSLTLWQARVDRYRDIDFSAYVQDGTVFGHYLIDEPNDPNNWNGVPIPGSTVEAMARYSKEIWPDLPTLVRTEPTYLAKDGTAYFYLDAAWAQYVTRKGEVGPFLDRNVADARTLGLELVVGLNLLDGATGGVAMTATQVRDWGSVLLSSSYPCAFVSYKYDATYLAPPEMGGAMDHLRSLAQNRPTRSCRASRGSPPPDPGPLATSTRIAADSPDPSEPGQAFTVRVDVTADGGTPSGSVALSVSGADESCTIALTDGTGTCSLALATAGSRTLTAAYGGAAGFAASSDTEPHTVEEAGPQAVEIAWSQPAAITYGTALGGAQLNAAATAGGQPVAGSFAYQPDAGAVLDAGQDHQLTATFTPGDPDSYQGGTAGVRLTVNPATPTLAWVAPASTLVGPLSASLLTASATGIDGAAVQGTFTYSPAAGQFLDARPSQTLSVSFQPSSSNYTAATRSVSLAVLYPWSGYFEPTDNPQVLNTARAGVAIPVRFSLGGNRPAPVLASGSPEVTSVNCPPWPTDAIEETVSASSSDLQYESSTGRYVYTWKTQKSYAGKCRRFRLVLKDGTVRDAVFRFVK